MKINTVLLSVILPIYNEKKRLENLLTITSYLRSKKYTYEVIVVDDGSEKQTKHILTQLRKKIRFIAVHVQTNRGKGYAIQQGMLRATGKYRIFMDIDLSTPIENIEIFLKSLRSYPIVIATRKSDKSNVLNHQPFLREVMGKMFTRISELVTGVNVSDFTCGFKGFSSTSAKKLFSKSRIERWSFDAEILFLANKYEMKIKEIPINWKNDKETKVVFPRDIFISLTELLQIRLNDMMGKYS